MKRIFSIILTVLLTATSCVFPVAAETLLIASNPGAITFSDVSKETTQGQSIYKLAEAGILVGDGDGTFRPDAPITRAELSKIVNAIFAYTEKAETGFSDMKGDEWFYPYVLVAKKAGYIIGYADGTFRADDYVSREQACVILCRVAGLYDLGLTFTISDPIAEWAMPYVQTVLGNGMMALEEGNTFRATQNITRAEFSVVFANFLKTTPEDSTGGTDNTGGGSGNTGGGSGNTGGGSGNTGGGSGNTGGGSGNTGGGSGNTGGGSGNTGGETPPPVEPDYEAINADMLTNLQAASADIQTYYYQFPVGNCRNLIGIIKNCIDGTITQGSSQVIDADFVRTAYAGQIDQAQALYDAIQADSEQKGAFQEALSYLNSGTINWLANEFGVL